MFKFHFISYLYMIRLSRQLKEKDKKVIKLLDENYNLKTEISESKQTQFVQ